MTFTKESATILGRKGLEAKKKHKEDLWAYIAGGGLRTYHELLEKQLAGEEIPKSAEKGMNRVETLIPFTKGKKGNVDNKGDTIPTNINILQTTTDELLRITQEGSNS